MDSEGLPLELCGDSDQTGRFTRLLCFFLNVIFMMFFETSDLDTKSRKDDTYSAHLTPSFHSMLNENSYSFIPVQPYMCLSNYFLDSVSCGVQVSSFF